MEQPVFIVQKGTGLTNIYASGIWQDPTDNRLYFLRKNMVIAVFDKESWDSVGVTYVDKEQLEKSQKRDKNDQINIEDFAARCTKIPMSIDEIKKGTKNDEMYFA